MKYILKGINRICILHPFFVTSSYSLHHSFELEKGFKFINACAMRESSIYEKENKVISFKDGELMVMVRQDIHLFIHLKGLLPWMWEELNLIYLVVFLVDYLHTTHEWLFLFVRLVKGAQQDDVAHKCREIRIMWFERYNLEMILKKYNSECELGPEK